MKANELRVGNFVILKSKCDKDEIALLLTIDEINGCYYNRASNKKYINRKYDGKNSWCTFKIINPIPITEDWLLRFGYKKDGDNYQGKFHKIWKCNDLFVCEKNGIVLKTIHQLQNLYFTLTGIELTYKTEIEP